MLSPAWSTDWISEEGRRKLAAGGIAPPGQGAGPHRRPGAAEPGPDPPDGVLPALRLGRHRGALGVRRHRLQGAAPLPQLPRAVRARQGDLTDDDRRPERPPPPAVPPPDRREGREAHRRRRRGHLRHPRRAGRGLPLQAGPGAHPAPGRRRPRRAPVVLDLRADGRPAAGRRPRGARRLLLLLPGPPGAAGRHDRGAAAVGHVHRRPLGARRPRLRRRRVRASRRRCRWPAPCCGTGRATVTVFYGNRRTNTVMFADELADLKDRYGTRLQLVHVLSREPRDAELTSGRLDEARLRALVENLVDAPNVDHWWLCGPHGMVDDARALLAELGVPTEKVHQELFYVDDVPPEPVRGDEETVTGPSSQVTVDPRRPLHHPGAPPRRVRPRLGPEGARRPAVRLQGRGLRHLPGAGHRRRGGHAAQLRAGGQGGRRRLRADLPDAADHRTRSPSTSTP